MRKFYTLLILGLLSLQAFSQSIPEYCLDNPKVAAYFSEPEYNPDDYSYTYITDYCYPLPWNWKKYGDGERLDHPLPAKVILQNPLAAEGTLYVSENADYSDALVLSVAAGAQSIDVYNLIPNRTYNWKVVDDASGDVVESGQFKTTGHVRMLKIDGIFNVRDMGGYPTLGGTTMKYGKIIRGSRLNVNGSTQKIITDEGIAELLRLGVLAELDMRDESNAPMPSGSSSRHSYLGDDIPIANFTGAYQSRIATFADAPHSIQGIKQMIAWFKQDRPVYLHCSVGADRTGTVAYLVGALCGMSEDALARDFELTSFSGDSVDNEADHGTWEILVRQRTDVGRLDKCSSPESYRFSDMVAKIKSFPGATFQRKVYNHLREGVQGVNISAEDLSFLVKYLTGYSILAGFNTDVDTLRLEVGQTQKINVSPFPEEAEYSSISFKSTSEMIATVSEDGVVTAVGGGSANIIVDVDGIEKLIPVIVPITEESLQEYSMYNDVVAQYMGESAYVDDDYSSSYIDKYADMILEGSRADWPQSFTIQWMPYNGATDQHLYISDTVNFWKSIIDVSLSSNVSTYRVDNLDAGKVYYYKITATLSGKKVDIFSSAFKLSSTVKMIKIQELYNVRDLGGWTGLDGRSVRYGVLYRGSRLRRNLSEKNGGNSFTAGVEELGQKLKVDAELDLRSNSEVSSTLKVAATNRYSSKFKKIGNAKDCLGANILNGDAYIVGMQQIINWLKMNRIIYMSGSLGAERTGTMAFLINGLLGVSEDGLARDYELSSFTGDYLAEGQVWKRSDSNYADMVSAIKSLDSDATLQENIYKYFNVGVNGKSIAKTDLDWFIDYMLEEVKSPFTDVEPISIDKPEVIKHINSGKIYNMYGFEADITGPGLYIIDGKTVYVTE